MPTTQIKHHDPRVIRTRQLIVDAFDQLLHKRDFNSITVSDISKQATINRATFYAHFTDKYALIDRFLSSTFMDFVYRRVDSNADLSEETMKNLIISLCEYHEASNKRCMKNYDTVAPLVEKNVKNQLEGFILQLMIKDCEDADQETLEIAANMLTWSIYGTTYRWNLKRKPESPEDFAVKILPILKVYMK
jgi:AcrR family transcriptional regulator